MAISLKRTGMLRGATKFLVHAPSGNGKTKLVRTLPRPVIVSAENGLASLRDDDLFYIEVKTIEDVHEVYQWFSSDEAAEFDSVAIDSITEIAEVVLSAEKKTAKDPRQAYGEMQDQMADLVRAFRDIPRHVYMIAKTEKTADAMGSLTYAPMMPGKKFGQQLPYFFDEVFALHAVRNTEGTVDRMLQTQADGLWTAKDRSGRLDMWEPPDLGAIIAKIEAPRGAP